MSDKDSMGDRLKGYEALESARRFMPLLPVYARIDGRCFSRFTHGLNRPYDERITNVMVAVTAYLVEAMHACIGYTQSDEISLAWVQDSREAELPFGGKIAKMTSVLAGMASAKFNQCCRTDTELNERAENQTPHFDCRVFQLPNLTEAANTFLWRERDATKNAVSMAARSFYSAKELHGKRIAEMQEMIFQKGQNFNDYPAFFKRGTFLRRVVSMREFTESELARIPEGHRPEPGALVERSHIIELDMPAFGTVSNREDVIFKGANPVLYAPA
jgi:tRNA(His) guanylyltransferase